MLYFLNLTFLINLKTVTLASETNPQSYDS